MNDVVETPTSAGISVVMATYNGARYLREQVQSILPQLADNDELVISDDRSTDDTPAILQDFAEPRVRLVSTTGRLGPIRNFEHGLGFACGEVIVLADQDDVWLPDRLARVRDHFAVSRGRYELLVSDSTIVDEHLNPTQGSLFALLQAGPGLAKNIYRNTYVGCHMAFRRALLDVATPFPAAIPMHDMWLGLVSELLGPVTFDPEPVILFRRSGHNYTQLRYSLGRRVTWRLGLIAALVRLRLSDRFRANDRRAHDDTAV